MVEQTDASVVASCSNVGVDVADFNGVGTFDAVVECIVPAAPVSMHVELAANVLVPTNDVNVLVPTNVFVMVSNVHAYSDGCDVPVQAAKVVHEALKGVDALMNSLKAAKNVNQNAKKGREKGKGGKKSDPSISS
ncbi:hypothetical protein V6N13_029581 [Hibiscus sabdariffa]|uniref:Uncharacterized protein n=2 Tax=Hibiscus sabdariffa TaxID=183260 RepID=A0ABR2AHE8_9ROSI